MSRKISCHVRFHATYDFMPRTISCHVRFISCHIRFISWIKTVTLRRQRCGPLCSEAICCFCRCLCFPVSHRPLRPSASDSTTSAGRLHDRCPWAKPLRAPATTGGVGFRTAADRAGFVWSTAGSAERETFRSWQ